MEVDYGNEGSHPIPAFRSRAGRGWNVVQSAAAAAAEHQMDDPMATVEVDQVPPRWVYFVSVLGFAGAGEEVLMQRFRREPLALEQVGSGEPVERSGEAAEAQ